MTTNRPFGMQRHTAPRQGGGGKGTARQHGDKIQNRMAVATEFPLPRLDRFEWDQMKLADLTGATQTGPSIEELYIV